MNTITTFCCVGLQIFSLLMLGGGLLWLVQRFMQVGTVTSPTRDAEKSARIRSMLSVAYRARQSRSPRLGEAREVWLGRIRPEIQPRALRCLEIARSTEKVLESLPDDTLLDCVFLGPNERDWVILRRKVGDDLTVSILDAFPEIEWKLSLPSRYPAEGDPSWMSEAYPRVLFDIIWNSTEEEYRKAREVATSAGTIRPK